MENSLLFSDTIECTILSWSPDGSFLAHDSISSPHSSKQFHQSEIIIRDLKSELGFFKAFNYKSSARKSKISCVSWSSDSCYIAVGLYEDGIVHIFCLDSTTNFKCKIDVGDEFEGVGLIDFCWSPRSRHVLTTASEYIQLTIWPLCSPATSRNILYVRDIMPIEKYKTFSEDGSKLALAQYDLDLDGKKSQEKENRIITVYNVTNWKPEIVFSVKIKDLMGIKWCPDASLQTLLLWDSPLFSNLYLYSTKSGHLLKHIVGDELSVGIRTIEWSPTGHFIIFSNHNNKIRMLNGLSYGILLEETIDIDSPQIWADCVIYKEEDQHESSKSSTAIGFPKYKYSVCKKIPHSIVRKTRDETKLKTDMFQFSYDGKYMALYLQSFTNILWIWDLAQVKLCSVLVQKHSISAFTWNPQEQRLCVCTGNHYVYFWTPFGCFISKFPDDDLIAVCLEWNLNGSKLAVSSGQRMSCCTFTSM